MNLRLTKTGSNITSNGEWGARMIPGQFDYHRPSSVDEAVKLLVQYGDDGRVIAGGHSLIPMMKLRLAQPAHLIDLGGLRDLAGVREDGGSIVIGALTTQHELLQSPLLRERCPCPECTVRRGGSAPVVATANRHEEHA